MTPNMRYRSCPLFHEGATAPTFIPGQWNVISPTTGSITQADGTFLSVQADGSYQGRTTVGQWETFTADPANGPMLSVTSDFGLVYRIPYSGF